MTEQEIIDQAIAILKSRLHRPEHFITCPGDTCAYLKLHLAELEYESFQVMFLNTKNGLISLTEMFRGTLSKASIYPREVVKMALHFNAAAVILSHNHPSGNTDPSAADKSITEQLTDALQLVDVQVLDHIIVGGDETYSFAEHGLL